MLQGQTRSIQEEIGGVNVALQSVRINVSRLDDHLTIQKKHCSSFAGYDVAAMNLVVRTITIYAPSRLQ